MSDRSDDQRLLDRLRRRGVIDTGDVAIRHLSGGVSNEVLAVTDRTSTVIVKRALSRLRVAEEWLASTDRVLIEAAALRRAALIQPERVPPVLDVDRDAYVIVIGCADVAAREWRSDLLSGTVDLAVPALLGRTLARWHEATTGDPPDRGELSSTAVFHQLRVDPFYRWTAKRHADISAAIDSVVERMAATRTCLVHGDFSPKNILLWPGTTWVIDWEVAHFGDPTFDLGFLLAHLVCKSLHRPQWLSRYQDAATTFLQSYRDSIAARREAFNESHLAAQIGCLVLARMDGKSPVPYLDDDARAKGRAFARNVILDRPDTIDDLWRSLQ